MKKEQLEKKVKDGIMECQNIILIHPTAVMSEADFERLLCHCISKNIGENVEDVPKNNTFSVHTQISHYNKKNGKYSIGERVDILALDDCGLINSSGTIALDQTMDSEPRIVLDFGSFVFIGKDSNGKKLTVMEYPLTVSGRELYKIAGGKLSDNVIKDICSTIIRKNKGIELTLHRVKNRIGDSVSYEMTPISIE